MLTDQDLERGLAEAFRDTAGPAAWPAAGPGAVDTAGLFRRGVARRRRQLTVRTAGVVAALALVAGGLGGYLAAGTARAGSPAAGTYGHGSGAPGPLLDAAVTQPLPTATAAAGMPRYYAVADHSRPTAVVYASGTGRVLSTVGLPTGVNPKVSQIAAAPGGRLFVLALSVVATVSANARTAFYQFTVGRGGRAGRLSTLPVPALPAGVQAESLAVSPRGDRVAVGMQEDGGQRGAIEIATLHADRARTAAVHIWTSNQPGSPGQLSWAGQGNELGFFWRDDRPAATSAAGLWLLDAPDGIPESARRVLPAWVGGDAVQSALLSPDGSTLVAAVSYEGVGQVSRGTVIGGIVQISVRTRRPVSMLLAEHAAYSADPGEAGWYLTGCQLPAADASGRHLLVSCDRFGRLDLNRFTPLPGAPAQTAVAAAW